MISVMARSRLRSPSYHRAIAPARRVEGRADTPCPEVDVNVGYKGYCYIVEDGRAPFSWRFASREQRPPQKR
jgi:hypothetical protein